MRYLPFIIFSVLALWMAGCGGPPPHLHYSTTGIKHPKVTKQQQRALTAKAQRIASERLVRFRRGAGRYKTVKANKVNILPLASLMAIHMVSGDSYRGAEADLMVRVKGVGFVPVSVQIDLKGNLKVDQGGKNRAQPKESKHLPKFRKGKVKWTSKSKQIVVHAISLLSDREARIVRNVPFSRYKVGTGEHRDKGAIYKQKGCGAEIRIFNRTFASDRTLFTGEARSPRPASLRMVLHEIGHAIHNFPGRKASCDYHAESKKMDARIQRYNQTVKKANATQDPKLQQFLSKEGPKITRHKAKLARLGKQARTFSAFGPVLSAYKRVLGKGRAPTAYGETTLRESFAESYSLYRADPRALSRLLPQVSKWFNSGGHLKAK